MFTQSTHAGEYAFTLQWSWLKPATSNIASTEQLPASPHWGAVAVAAWPTNTGAEFWQNETHILCCFAVPVLVETDENDENDENDEYVDDHDHRHDHDDDDNDTWQEWLTLSMSFCVSGNPVLAIIHGIIIVAFQQKAQK